MRDLGDLWRKCHDGTIPLGQWGYERKLTIDDVIYYDDSILDVSHIKGVMYGAFAIGNAMSKEINVKVIPHTDYSINSKAVIKLEMRVYTINEERSEWAMFGEYLVDNAELNAGVWSITGYDYINYLDEEYKRAGFTEKSWPTSSSVVIKEIAKYMGVEVDSSSPIDESIFIDNPDTITIRDTLGYIASLHGGNFHISDDNKLKLVIPRFSEPVGIVNESNSSNIITGESIRFDSVEMSFGDEIDDKFISGDGKNVLKVFNPWATKYSTDKILNILSDYVHHSYEITSTDIDPAVEIGDTILVNGKQVILNQAQYSLRMFVNITNPSKVDEEMSNSGISRRSSNVAPQASFNMLWDTNIDKIEVGTKEIEIAAVEVDMASAGSGQGQLLINLLSDSDTEAIIKVYDNDTQELYSPINVRIYRGNNNIGIPLPYVGKGFNIHTLSVSIQSRSGKFYIQPRNVIYDVEILGAELSKLGLITEDISIRQPNLAISPTDIYLIGYGEEGVVSVYRAPYILGRKYRDTDFNLLWELQGLTNVKNLLIEFNGIFELLEGRDIYSLITQDKPWIFWIDEHDSLWGQYGDEPSTRQILAEGVIQASAIRGWNAKGHEDDMGLILSYIKYDGVVAYRQLLGLNDILNGDNVNWNQESILTEAGNNNNNVYVNRLADYRVSFSVSGIDKIFISDRLYIGQASPIEYVNFNNEIDDWMTIIGVIPKGDLPYNLQPEWSTEDGKTFKLKAPYKWNIRGDSKKAFNIVDNGSTQNVESIYVDTEDPYTLIIEMDGVVTMGTLIISLNPEHILGQHPNGTDIEVNQDILVYEVVLNNKETIEFNLSIDSDLDIYQKRTLLLNNDEVVNIDLSISKPEIDVIQVEKIYLNKDETVIFNLDMELDLEVFTYKEINP